MKYKNIILIYHIPVDNLTRRDSEYLLEGYYDALQDSDYQRVLVFPYTEGTPKKIIIETIDLKNTINSKTIESSLEDIKMKFLKLYEPEKWKRIKKINELMK